MPRVSAAQRIAREEKLAAERAASTAQALIERLRRREREQRSPKAFSREARP
jgi:hypothetical protein